MQGGSMSSFQWHSLCADQSGNSYWTRLSRRRGRQDASVLLVWRHCKHSLEDGKSRASQQSAPEPHSLQVGHPFAMPSLPCASQNHPTAWKHWGGQEGRWEFSLLCGRKYYGPSAVACFYSYNPQAKPNLLIIFKNSFIVTKVGFGGNDLDRGVTFFIFIFSCATPNRS